VHGDSPAVTDDVWLTRTGFTGPTTLFYSNAEPTTAEPEVIKQLPAMYNAADLEVTQGEATSKDGTKIPYFQIAKTGLVRDGNTPTLLYGYELHVPSHQLFFWLLLNWDPDGVQRPSCKGGLKGGEGTVHTTRWSLIGGSVVASCLNVC